MTKFTVFFTPGGDQTFDDDWRYKIEPNGVLEIVGPDRQRLIYSTSAWHHVSDQAPQSKRQ